MKKVSVITINYNNKAGLLKTVKSVISQSYPDFEYIIIDGGSTDGSLEVVREYSDKIDYWSSEPDEGIYNAMNKGIVKANGEYLIFMNSGDSFHSPDVLSRIFPLYNEDIITGEFIKGQLSYPWKHLRPTVTMLDLFKGTFNHQSTFIKRSLFNQHPYDEQLRIVSDWKFFVEALVFRNCSFRNTDVIIAHYDDTGMSANQKDLYFAEREHVLKELLPERIYTDYKRFAESDSPLLELTPALKDTHRFQRLVYKVVSAMIRLYSFFGKFKK